MNNGKQGLKVLGISLLAALGLMAFGASGASASGTFLISGVGAPWEETVSGKGINLLNGRFWVLGLNIEIYCHTATGTGKISSGGTGTATLTFSSCLTSGTQTDGKLKGETCPLEENIIAKVRALVVLHNSKPYIQLTPEDGLTFAEVGGEPCIPGAKVKGSVVASISNPDGDDAVKTINTEGILTLFSGDDLFYGVNEAHLKAEAEVELSGARKGTAWGAA
jgi:hypothetical protein